MADFLNDSIVAFKEAVDALNVYKKSLNEVVKLNQKMASGVNPAKAKTEDINKLAQAEKVLTNTEKKLIEVSKEEIAIRKKLLAATSRQGKIRAENNLILAEAKKKVKEQAKLSLGLSNAYQEESKRLNDVRNKYKALAVQGKENSRVAKVYLKDIQKTDAKLKAIDKTVGQNFRSVGDYKGAISSLTPVLGSFGSKLNQIQATLGAAKEGFKKMAGAQEGAAKSSKVLSFAMKAIPIFAIVGAISALIAAFAGTQRGMDAITKVTRPLKALFDSLLGVIQDVAFWFADKLGEALDNPVQAMKDLGQAILDNVINRFKGLIVLGEAVALLVKGEFAKAALKGADAMIQMGTGVTNATDKIVEAKEALVDFVDESVLAGLELDALIKKFEKLELASIVPLAKMKLEFQELKKIANDQLKTDEERIIALNKAAKVQTEISRTEGELIQLRIDAMVLQQSLNDTTREDEKELQQLRADQINFEATAQKKIAGLVSLRTGIELRQYKARLDNIDEFSKVAIKKERELVTEIAKVNNDAIDAADKKRVDDLLKRKAEELQFAKDITSAFGTELDERIKLRSEALKKEETDINKNISRQEQRAAQGLENTLAFENEKLAQNQLKQLEAEKKAAQLKEAIRLGELFLTLKEAEAQERVEGSTARALSGVAEAKAITAGIKATLDLAGFEKGGLVEGGEQIIRINEKGNEFVIDADTTAALGLNKPGSNMGDFKGMMSMHEMNKSDRVVQNKDGSYKVVKALQSLESTIVNKPETSVNIDELGNIITTMKKGGYTTTNKLKTGRRSTWK